MRLKWPSHQVKKHKRRYFKMPVARTVCKTFRIKKGKRKGKTFTRKVRILKSGKMKFVKGTCRKVKKKVTKRRRKRAR